MTLRGAALFAIALGLSCHRDAREAPDASAIAPPTVTPIIAAHDGGLSPAKLAEMLRSGDEEADASVTSDAGGACPLPIHPNYCRRGCRNYASREFSMHARRMSPSRRSGKGRCGANLVFAEEQRAGDGGVGGTLVEYFDATTKELVAAEDSRRTPCGSFGQVPRCKLEIDWGPVRP